MSAALTPITLVGGTGLTGSASVKALLASTHPFALTTLTRRPLDGESSNPSTTYTNKTFSDLFEAVKGPVATKGGVYVSCLGTTRAAAGGLDKQIRIDLDLNRDLAQKAKEDGASTMILVSSGGSSSSSMMPYMKMKGQLEDAVKGMGFERCVILQPGMLLGHREQGRFPENILQHVFRGLRAVGVNFSVEGTDVGECIAQLAANPPEGAVTVVSNSQIIDLAKKWREANPGTTSAA